MTEQRSAETHVCGNCGAQTHSLVGQLQADGSWHCFNCAHGNVVRTSKPLVERLRAWTRGIEDSPSGCPAAEAANEIERLTRERDDAEALAQSLQNRWATRPLDHPSGEALIAENDRLRAALERIKGCSHEGRMLPMCYAIAVDALGSICFCGHCLDCLRRERGGVADEPNALSSISAQNDLKRIADEPSAEYFDRDDQIVTRAHGILSALVDWAKERPQIDPSPIGHICQRAKRLLVHWTPSPDKTAGGL